MTLRAFLRTIVKGYAIVLVSLAVAIAIAIVYLSTQQTSYRASAVVLVDVGLPQDSSAKALNAAITYSDYRTVTVQSLVTTDAVLEDVSRRLDLRLTAKELADHVTALAPQDTSLVEVRVDWPDARKSAVIANAIAQEVVDDFSAKGDPVKVELRQVTRAVPATSPVPNPAEAIGLAVFSALLVSSAWLFVRRVRRAPSSYSEG